MRLGVRTRRWVALVAVIAAGVALLAPQRGARAGTDDTPSSAATRQTVSRAVDGALAFLRAKQNPDGSFGDRQQRLQTGLTILAFLSSGKTPDADPASPLPKALAWVLTNTGEDGFMGDPDYPMESHAICTMALSESLGMIGDEATRRTASARWQAAMQYTLAQQDKAVGAEFYGGWKIEPKTKVNDRIVTAWHLMLLRSAELRGFETPKSSLSRAVEFVEGSQKVPAEGKTIDRNDIGGFSYDASGLPVTLATSAGLMVMSMNNRPADRRGLALAWLSENQPVWFGPNFYTTHIFASRALAREARRTDAAREQAARYSQRVWEILREHQTSDGGFDVPPGNAENTKQMGATYATPAAILILNANRGLLPVDALE